MNYIGIDFGTSNCVVCNLTDYGELDVVRFGDSLVVPSVVTLSENEQVLYCGQAAKELAGVMGEERSVLSVKRVLGTNTEVRLGRHSYPPESIAYELFRYLKDGTERYLGKPVTRAVITVPANSKGLQRKATKVCAEKAGFKVLTLINEPTAAAMAYGIDLEEERYILVYDFGGGTFDVTVLHSHHGILEEIQARGIRKLGGDDMDERLAEEIARRARVDYSSLPRIAQWRLKLEAEKAKIRLSDEESVIVNIQADRRIGLPPISVEITRREFTKLVWDLIERTKEPILEAINASRHPSGRNLTFRDIDTLLLVGGTSKIPAVREFVENLVGLQAQSGVDPMTCIAQGAAIASGIIQGAPNVNKVYIVRLEHSLCPRILDITTMQDMLHPLIPRGTAIPTKRSHIYGPVRDNQDRAEIVIYEGDVYDNPEDENNVKIGTVELPIDPPRPKDQVAIEVTFTYGDDGILQVEAKDLGTGRGVRATIDYAYDIRVKPTGIPIETESTPGSAGGTLTKPPEPVPPEPVPEEILETAKKYLSMADKRVEKLGASSQRGKRIGELAERLRRALERGSRKEIEKCIDDLGEELLW
jgi:molecular chaperone DnaK